MSKIKQSLKDAHPDWSEETLQDRAQRTLGDVWYNRMTPEDRAKYTKKYESLDQSKPTGLPSDLTAEDMAKCLAIAKEEPAEWTPQEASAPMPDQLNRTDRVTKESQDESTDFEQSTDEVQPPYQQGIDNPDDSLGGGGDDPDADEGLDEEASANPNPTENMMGPKNPPPGMLAKELTTKERKKVATEDFAYPEEKKLPIHDESHVRNALARWNQTDIPADKKSAVLRRICTAAKRFGIESDLCKEKGHPSLAASAQKSNFFAIPRYRFPYVATPKPGFEGNSGPILIKAVVLEEGMNVNKWRVRPSQFQKVADAYKSGRQLRTDHSKDMDKVIGKSYNGMVMMGNQLPQYLGTDIQGLNPAGQYVVAEFEADPKNPQVRTNILSGYVETGSIGLDAKAFCAECGLPLEVQGDEMVKTCRHYDAGVDLDEVDTKEYSYVAEPAFEHTMAFPSFAAAVSSSLSHMAGKSPQLSASSGKVTATAKAEGRKAESEGDGDDDGDLKLKMYRKGYADALADAAKFRAVDVPPAKPGNIAEADAEAEGEGKSEADADAEGEGEGKGEADAGVTPPSNFKPTDELKDTPQQLGPGTFRQMTVPNPDSTHPVQGRRTDQVGRMQGRGVRNGVTGASLFDQAWHATAYQLKDPALKEIFKAAANQPDTPSSIKSTLGRKDLRWE